MNRMNKKTKKGFTLVETFIAITVLIVSLVGPLSIAADSLKSAYYARDEITAFYLAQEGLEYVRALRDQNYLASPAQPWLTGITDCLSSVGANPPNVSCQVDFPNFSHSVCANNLCTALVVDSNGLFNTQNGTKSNFTRTLTIVPVAGTSDEVAVGVTVSWVSAGINRSFKLSEHLFNWL